MKNILHIIGNISIIIMIYAIFAGIWEFNPTLINSFNLKIFFSSLIIILISIFGIVIIDNYKKEELKKKLYN